MAEEKRHVIVVTQYSCSQTMGTDDAVRGIAANIPADAGLMSLREIFK